MNPITWLLSLWKKKPAARRPRRPKCSCGHWWREHFSTGCSVRDAVLGMCLCTLNRYGQRRALAAVKEGAA